MNTYIVADHGRDSSAPAASKEPRLCRPPDLPSYRLKVVPHDLLQGLKIGEKGFEDRPVRFGVNHDLGQRQHVTHIK
jgi:hypothetical protein